jgi:phosphomannomutase
VESIDDLAAPTNGLPPTDGLRIWLAGGIRVIIRPSGTEAKLKCYIEVITTNGKEAELILEQLREPLKKFLTI